MVTSRIWSGDLSQWRCTNVSRNPGRQAGLAARATPEAMSPGALWTATVAGGAKAGGGPGHSAHGRSSEAVRPHQIDGDDAVPIIDRHFDQSTSGCDPCGGDDRMEPAASSTTASALA